MMTNNERDFILPAKVTGFYDIKKEKAPPITDVEKFKYACKLIGDAPEFGWLNFIEFSAPRTRSYHFGIFKRREDNAYIKVLCNKYYPLIAYTYINHVHAYNDAIYAIPEFEFEDIPELDEYFNNAFTILPQSILTTELNPEDVNYQSVVQNLTNTEFAQFAYWQPKMIGEIVYNCWH